MKFKNLANSKNDKVFLLCTEAQVQAISQKITGRKLNLKELRCLKKKLSTMTRNLIIQIDSSGISE